MKAFSLDQHIAGHKARTSAFKARKAEVGLLGVLRSSGGAIDLASIMVGVLVIGIVGGVIAAAVFGVVPWAQDNAAKQALGSVATAESVAYATSSDKGAAKFLDDAAITTTGAPDDTALLQQSDKIKIAVSPLGSHYVAVSKSDNGNLFYSFSEKPNTVIAGGKVGGPVPTAITDALAAQTGGDTVTTAPVITK